MPPLVSLGIGFRHRYHYTIGGFRHLLHYCLFHSPQLSWGFEFVNHSGIPQSTNIAPNRSGLQGQRQALPGPEGVSRLFATGAIPGRLESAQSFVSFCHDTGTVSPSLGILFRHQGASTPCKERQELLTIYCLFLGLEWNR